MTLHVLPSTEPSLDLIETLERLLHEARNGRVTGIAFALEIRGGDVSHGWTTHRNTHVLMAAVTQLQLRMVRDKLEQAE